MPDGGAAGPERADFADDGDCEWQRKKQGNGQAEDDPFVDSVEERIKLDKRNDVRR